MRIRSYLILFLIFILISRAGTAQKFTYLGLKEGLSQASVKCISQDFRGFIWVGTADGLNRYDGYTFNIYRNSPENYYSVSGNDITFVYENPFDSLMWVGTQDAGLNLYDRNRYRFIKLNPAHQKL